MSPCCIGLLGFHIVADFIGDGDKPYFNNVEPDLLHCNKGYHQLHDSVH